MATLSKKAAQGQQTRRALLAAAREEFGARGYAETSIDEIAARAAMTKGAFYHHFRGKQDLFVQVFEDVKKELSRAAFVIHEDHRPFAAPDEQPEHFTRLTDQTNEQVWNQLLERCRRYVELHTDPSVSRIVLVDARQVLPWEEWQRVESEHGVTLLRADLRRSRQRRIIVPLPLHTLAVTLAGSLNEICLLVANAEDPAAALEEAMQVMETLLAGLRLDDTSQ